MNSVIQVYKLAICIYFFFFCAICVFSYLISYPVALLRTLEDIIERNDCGSLFSIAGFTKKMG